MKEQINERHYWFVKIRFKGDAEKDWSKINPEPKLPCCSFEKIYTKCCELLEKHSSITQIKIISKSVPTKVYIFDRTQLKEIL